MRFAFCKKYETLKRAAERLATVRAEGVSWRAGSLASWSVTGELTPGHNQRGDHWWTVMPLLRGTSGQLTDQPTN